MGVLNSATLSANFTAQTVQTSIGLSFSTSDPVNLSNRDLALAVTAGDVPISGQGFDSQMGGWQSMSCSGDCRSYYGGIRGTLLGSASGGVATGAVGNKAALSYVFYPFPESYTGMQPYADLIQGLAVLGTASAPQPGITASFADNANVGHEALCPTNEMIWSNTYVAVARRASAAGSNYLFDANGNLMRIFDTPYTLFQQGVEVPSSSGYFNVPAPLANARVSFGGGGSIAAERYEHAATGMRLGRWQGGRWRRDARLRARRRRSDERHGARARERGGRFRGERSERRHRDAQFVPARDVGARHAAGRDRERA